MQRLPLTPLLLLLAAVSAPEDPGTIVRHARLAVEGDSAAPVGERWTVRLTRDSTDRGAILGLATLARLAYDDVTADRLYRRLVPPPPSPLDRFSVYAMLGLARGLYEAARLGEADSLLVRARIAARAVGDSVAEADALQALGNLRIESADLPLALAHFDSALALLPSGESETLAGARCRRAYALFLMGDPGLERELAAALELAREARARRAEVQCLRAASGDLLLRGREDSSLALLGEAVDLLRAVRDRRTLASTLTIRADVLRDLGAYGEARETLHEALAEARASHHPRAEALALQSLGTLYFSLRDMPSAARFFDRAFAAYTALDDSAGGMTVASWRARISLAYGDLAAARRKTLESIEYFERVGNVPYTIELYLALAYTAMLADDWSAAAVALDRSEALIREHGSRAWSRLGYQRGRLALHQGRLDQAEHLLREYLAALEPTDLPRRHEAGIYLADVLARRGDLEGAERQLTAAGNALEAWRATLTDQELRVWAFQPSASDESDRNSSVARVVAALAAGGRVEAALGLAERRRARELGDRMLEAAALQLGPAPPVDGAAAGPAWSLIPAEIAGSIPDDSTALIEYVTGSHGAPTTVFVVTRGGAIQANLLVPADSLADPIGQFARQTARGAEAPREGRRLARLLLQPALASLPPRVVRLVVVPDGPLHRVPWDALRLQDGRYLVEHYALGIAPSAGTVAALWRRSRTGSPASTPVRLLAMADPAFGADTGAYGSLFTAAGGLRRLRGSGQEARTVARYASSAVVRLRHAASADWLLGSSLTRFGVIHLATPALVDERAPARTALALAPGVAEDGFVTPGELAALRLDADLVVLSGCRSASGLVADGEGVQGLVAPLLRAGARSVVATTWRVGERGPVELLDRFYGELARGKPVGEALRAAKLEAIRDGAEPRAWAGFTVVGDPLITVPLRRPQPERDWRMAGVLVLLAGAAGLAYRWMRRSARGAELRGSAPSVASRTYQR